MNGPKRKGRVPLLQEETSTSSRESLDEIIMQSSSDSSSNRMESFDAIEQKSSYSSSFRVGIPWKNREVKDDRYHGGLMKSSEPTKGKGSEKTSRLNKMPTKYRGLESEYLADDATASNFSASEWTPQDSAYGAACPVGGCIPKHVRRLIEFSLIAGMFFGFVYILVRTSVNIADGRKSHSYKNTSYVDVLNDDLYGGYNGTNNGNDDMYNESTDDSVGDDGYGQRFLLRRG